VTGWLIRRFIKNPGQAEDPQVRKAYGTLGSSVGIGLNLLLALGKLVLGLITGSLAIIADAANNLSDAFGSIVSLVSMRLAQKPMDREHPFGHGRLEYIGALGVGALILVMGVSLLKNGIKAMVEPVPLTLSLPVLLLLLAAIFVKLWLFFFYRTLGKKVGSVTLLAASKDSLSDVLATGGVLVSTGLQYAFGWQTDGIMGVLVALVVLRAGYGVCKDTVGQLLGEKPDPEKVRRIRERLLVFPGILGLHDLVLHDYGPGRCIASVHAEVSAQGDIVEIHEVIDQAEREIGREMNIVICIHMDPIVTEDETANAVKAKLETFLRDMDERLTLHDFRMVPGQQQVNLIFDCVLPDAYRDREALLRSLVAYAKSLDPRYEVIVQFDTDYLSC
jgi:cation diffusion facilitator family transporter